MKTKFTVLVLLVVFGIGLSSCEKEDNDGGASSKSWTIDGKSYTQKAAVVADDEDEFMLMVYNADLLSIRDNMNACTAVFKKRPTAGTYKVVGDDDSDNFGPNDMAFLFVESSGGKQYASLASNGTATVTVANGKIKVSLPKVDGIKVDRANPTATPKTIKVSVNISEE